MKNQRFLTLLSLIVSLNIAISQAETTNLKLNNERILGKNTVPTLGLDNLYIEGIITLVDRKENRLVTRDQSISITPTTSFTSDKRGGYITFRDLKIGSAIRLTTVYEEGEIKAISVHELNQVVKAGTKQKKTKEKSAVLMD